MALQSVQVVQELRLSEGSGGFAGVLSDGDSFGWSVTGVGDLDGNGVADVAVGAPLAPGAGSDRGEVWVLLLNDDGSVRHGTRIGDGSGGLTLALHDGDRFGHSLAAIPDLNGDGRMELCVGMPGTPAQGTPWPGGAAQDLGGGLPAGFEPSGLVWHEGMQVLVVVSDDGRVALVDREGTLVSSFYVGGDLEAVAVLDPAGHTVLVGVENPDSLFELDLTTEQLTGASWDLTPWMTGPVSAGLEALTFADGLAYAGLQDSGEIFVFELLPGGVVEHQRTLPPPGGRDDVSGLHYEQRAGILYAVYDPDNLILELDLNGSILRAYPVPGLAQEGLTLITGCPGPLSTLTVADEVGSLASYATYLAPCDGSGRLWGRGSVTVLFLAADGSVLAHQSIGHGQGGFGALLAEGDFFGSALAYVGDLEGDGHPELAVGAAHDDDGGQDQFAQKGAVYLLSMAPQGTVLSSSKISATSGGFQGSLAVGDGFGAAIAGPGDMDADGVPDLFVGVPYADQGGLQRGSVWGLRLGADGGVIQAWQLRGSDVGAQDGDGFASGLVAAPPSLTDGGQGLIAGSSPAPSAAAGSITVVSLSPQGAPTESHRISATEGGLSGPLSPGDHFGRGLALLGDLDGDGLDQLLVGAPGDDDSGPERGACWSLELERTSLGEPHCFGSSACPCGNAGDPSRGCANSVSLGARADAMGSASVSADDLLLSVSGVPGLQFGLVFMGPTQIAPAPFGDGLRCVGGSLFRFPARLSSAAGVLTEGPGIVGFTHANFSSSGHILPGETWGFQCWYRDPAGPCGSGSNASSALALTFTP